MSPLAGRAAARDNAGFIPAQADMAAPKSRRHKVVLETITQEKKKLRTAVSIICTGVPGQVPNESPS